MARKQTRREFIEANGATCRNWQWSWSFINENKRTVIFGAWDKHQAGNRSKILDEEWEFGDGGRKKAAYPQAREHVRLVEEEGYQLLTFPMVNSDIRKVDGVGPSTIGEFTPSLSAKTLLRIGSGWYATEDDAGVNLPEELPSHVSYFEGAAKAVKVNAYERNASARKACLRHHGYSCVVCSFNFELVYGQPGKGYIHVHHIVQLSEIRREYRVDPVKDLVPVCPNCHAMIHSIDPALTIEQLKNCLAEISGGRPTQHS